MEEMDICVSHSLRKQERGLEKGQQVLTDGRKVRRFGCSGNKWSYDVHQPGRDGEMRAEQCGPAEAPEAEFNIPRMYFHYPASLNLTSAVFSSNYQDVRVREAESLITSNIRNI
ncbi:unnamed protein product [Pleuronectes platessa]|uniref:Uncharacterized protein n=1 Tax=Pleuronectes platessa TaxID=8262 RepID=A0A9N7YJ58_PLEPL|nr:unnamed protein product [Pleuronectes platessa]